MPKQFLLGGQWSLARGSAWTEQWWILGTAMRLGSCRLILSDSPDSHLAKDLETDGIYQVSYWDLLFFVLNGLRDYLTLHILQAEVLGSANELSGYASLDMSEELGDALGRLGTWGVPWQ